MATLQLRDVSSDTVGTLRLRAAQTGQSLQAYVRSLLDREAAVLTPEAATTQAQQIAQQSDVSADDVLAAVEKARLN